MVEGIVRDVERVPHEIAMAGGHVPDQRAGRRRIRLRPPRQLSPAPPAPHGPKKRRRNPGSLIFRALRKLWIPLVILAVIVAGGLTVTRLHGIFGSEKRLSYAETRTDDTRPFNPKHLRYEIFGPPGTVAGISYFDANGDLQRVKGAVLPWSSEFAVTPATAGGNIAAQGDSDSLGCRIIVDGEVKAEKITHAVSAFTFCRLKADE